MTKPAAPQAHLNVFWNTARLKRLSWASILGLVLALVISLNLGRDRALLLISGDFPGLFVQAVILERGLQSRLYDPALQAQIENEFWPEFNGAYYMSVYPPFIGAFLKPLANINVASAGFLFRLANLLGMLAAVWILGQLKPKGRHLFLPRFAFLLCCAPVFCGVFGGQNTGFSMLLYAVIVWGLEHNHRRAHKLAAGIGLGLWFFKPQFGLIALAYAILSGQIWAALNALGVALGLYLLSARTMGMDWPIVWLKALSAFSSENYLANQHQQISIIGAAQAVVNVLGNQGLVARFAFWLGVLFTIAVIVKTAQELWRHKGNPRTAPAWLLVGPAICLISPQTLFYDMGIGLSACFTLADLHNTKHMTALCILIVLMAIFTLLRQSFSIPPLFLVNLVVYLSVYRLLRTAPPKEAIS